MADILTAAQLTTFRRDWLPDEVNLRREWANATLESNAVAGDESLDVAGLFPSLAIEKGAVVYITIDGSPFTFRVTADTTADVTGDATLAVSPEVPTPGASSGISVGARQIRRSLYNSWTSKQYFDDGQLLDLCKRAREEEGEWIARQGERMRATYTVMRRLGIERMLADSQFTAVYDSLPGGAAALERLRAQLEADRRVVEVAAHSATTVLMWK